MKLRALITATTITVVIASGAHADVCDYTPSALAGAAVAGGAAAAGVGLKAAGYYTLTHAGSNLIMLGSTAAGASAAGTVGIIGGTAGALGTIGAILMAPVTLVVGTVTVIGVGAYEGYCYFQIERVTDPYDVRRIIESIAAQDEAIEIISTDDGDAMQLTVEGSTETYLLRNLYVSDGNMMYRDWGFDTKIGPVAYTEAPKE